jgi:vitamin B12 transporter
MRTALKQFARITIGTIGIALTLAQGPSLAARPAPAHASPTPTPTPVATPSARPAPPNTLGRIITESAPRETYRVPPAEWERLGARTVADALRFVPGIVVQGRGTLGTLQTVSLRGANSSQTLVLLDGRPINEGDTGVVDFATVPVNGIASVAITEGGLSALYGSGAIGGVVQIESAMPSAHTSPLLYARLGYQGDFEDGVSFSVPTGSSGGVRVDAITQSARNTFDYPAFGSITGGTRTNNDIQASDIRLCICYQLSPRLSALVHLEDNNSDLGVPGSTEFGPMFISQLARQQRMIGRADMRVRFFEGSDSYTQLLVYSDGKRLHFYDPTPPFPFDTLTLENARGYDLSQALAIGRNDLLRVGAQGRADRALFQGTFNTPPSSLAAASATNFYFNDSFKTVPENFEADAGVWWNHTQGTAATAVPSVALRQRIAGDTWIRTSYARGFRAPNLDERYFPFFGNPKLAPEYAATFDAGVVAQSTVWRASATFFGSDTTNLIANLAIDSVGDFLPFNIGRARIRGFDAHLSNITAGRFGVQASYTDYTVARDLSTAPDLNGVVNYGNRILYQPTATASIELWRGAGYAHNGAWSGEDGIDLVFVGARYGDEENKHFLPPYATLGVHASRALNERVSLMLRVDNLTGQRVEQSYGLPVLGTTFSVRLNAH